MPRKVQVGSQASGAFVLYQMCSACRPFTGLESPAPCPQATSSPLGETRQRIGGPCVTSRYVGITKESLPLQGGTSRGEAGPIFTLTSRPSPQPPTWPRRVPTMVAVGRSLQGVSPTPSRPAPGPWSSLGLRLALPFIILNLPLGAGPEYCFINNFTGLPLVSGGQAGVCSTAERGDSAGPRPGCWLSEEGGLVEKAARLPSHLHPDHSGMLEEHLFPIVLSH